MDNKKPNPFTLIPEAILRTPLIRKLYGLDKQKESKLVEIINWKGKQRWDNEKSF